MAVVRRRAVATPRGYGLAWSALGAGAVALIGFQLLRQPEGSGGAPPARPFAAPSASSPAVRTSLPPSVRTAPAVPRTQGAASAPVGRSSSAGTAAPGRSGQPSPHPSPVGPGVVAANAALVVPLRGSTPIAVRVAVIAPAAPPFPTVGIGLLP